MYRRVFVRYFYAGFMVFKKVWLTWVDPVSFERNDLV
jgi:hypothetical protein